MKKILMIAATSLICLGAMVGCGSDPVQEDLINYINNEVPTIVELEDTTRIEYEAISGDNYTDDETMASALESVVIPASDELVAATEAVVPATEEVQAVHAKYLAAVTEQSEAFYMLLEALQNGDATMIDSVNEKLANADTLAEEFLADVDTLKEEHGVVTE